MIDRIFKLLEEKFPQARKDVLQVLARTYSLQNPSDETITQMVSSLTKEQIDDFAKAYRAGIDREVSESTKTYSENLTKKYQLVEKEKEKGASTTITTEEKTTDTPLKAANNTSDGFSSNDLTDIIKQAVAGAVRPLQEKIEAFEMEDAEKIRLTKLNEKLSSCKDDFFKEKVLKDYSRMSFADDEAFAEYLNDTEKDVSQINQRLADNYMAGQGRPVFSQKESSGVSTAVADYLKGKTNTSPLGGKEL